MGSESSSLLQKAPIVDIPAQGRIAGIPVPLRRFSDEDNDGCRAGTVFAYLGIPFAQPPVGSLRWKKPQVPAPSWRNTDGEGGDDDDTAASDVRPSRWRADPVQDLALSAFYSCARRELDAPSPLDLDGGMDDTVSEDCLYLNIWVPQNDRLTKKSSRAAAAASQGSTIKKRPVLVWVYGGSFVTGGASQCMFDGARLAHESGSIVVSLTYRVGIMGFLGSKQLAAESDGGQGCGNYGLWDLVAGFTWVKDNIAAFGGDSDNVTAFGESAGAIAIHALLVSTATPRDLFARACLESGTAMTVAPRTMPFAQATFRAIARKLGISPTGSDTDTLAKMREASPRQLLAAVASLPQRRPRTEYVVDNKGDRPRRRLDTEDQWSIAMDPSGLFAPVWDGVMIDEGYVARAVKGMPDDGLRNAQKGIILGCTADEGSLFSITMNSPQSMANHIAGYHPDVRPQLQALYGTAGVTNGASAYQMSSAFSGDNLFLTPVFDLMVRLAQRMSGPAATPAYGYIHSHRPSLQLLRGTLPDGGAVKLIGQMGALHMSEIPFVFGFDGTDEHVFARRTYPGTKDGCMPQGNGTGGQRGFTLAERATSLEWMRSLARFAHGEQPWVPLVDSQNTPVSLGTPASLSTAAAAGDLRIRLFDDMPRLGTTTRKAFEAVDTACANEAAGHSIIIRDGRLGEALLWTEPLVPADLDPAFTKSIGSAQDKHAFWTDAGFKNLLLAYYGDERIRYIA